VIRAGHALMEVSPVLSSTLNILPKIGVPFIIAVAADIIFPFYEFTKKKSSL
jgi:hypothetical protein